MCKYIYEQLTQIFTVTLRILQPILITNDQSYILSWTEEEEDEEA